MKAFELKKHKEVPLSVQYPYIQLKELDRKIENMNQILNEAVLPILVDASSADVGLQSLFLYSLAKIKLKGCKQSANRANYGRRYEGTREG